MDLQPTSPITSNTFDSPAVHRVVHPMTGFHLILLSECVKSCFFKRILNRRDCEISELKEKLRHMEGEKDELETKTSQQSQNLQNLLKQSVFWFYIISHLFD